MGREMGMRRMKTSSMCLRWLFKESSFHASSAKRETLFHYKTTSLIWHSRVSIDCLAKDVALFSGNAFRCAFSDKTNTRRLLAKVRIASISYHNSIELDITSLPIIKSHIKFILFQHHSNIECIERFVNCIMGE